MQPSSASLLSCLYIPLRNHRICFKFSCVPNFRGYFVEVPSFSVFILFNTRSSSSSVNCPSLTPSWLLMIFGMGFSVIFEGFRTTSWNVLSTSDVFLLGRQLLDSLTTCSSAHFIYCLLWYSRFSVSNEFLIYQFDLECLVIVLFSVRWLVLYWAFLTLWALVIVRFFLFNKDVFLTYLVFSLPTSDAYRTLHLALGLFDIHSASWNIGFLSITSWRFFFSIYVHVYVYLRGEIVGGHLRWNAIVFLKNWAL